jgi:hypothetical protein
MWVLEAVVHNPSPRSRCIRRLLRRLLERHPVLRREFQGIGQLSQGIQAGTRVDSPLEVTDRANAYVSQLGQFFLSDTSGGSMCSKQRAKFWRLIVRHHFGP